MIKSAIFLSFLISTLSASADATPQAVPANENQFADNLKNGMCFFYLSTLGIAPLEKEPRKAIDKNGKAKQPEIVVSKKFDREYAKVLDRVAKIQQKPLNQIDKEADEANKDADKLMNLLKVDGPEMYAACEKVAKKIARECFPHRDSELRIKACMKPLVSKFEVITLYSKRHIEMWKNDYYPEDAAKFKKPFEEIVVWMNEK